MCIFWSRLNLKTQVFLCLSLTRQIFASSLSRIERKSQVLWIVEVIPISYSPCSSNRLQAPPEIVYSCEICGQDDLNEAEMRTHMEAVHLKGRVVHTYHNLMLGSQNSIAFYCHWPYEL